MPLSNRLPLESPPAFQKPSSNERAVPPLRIGMFGLWGMNLPNRAFGGFETAFSEVAPRLVEKGHHVTIYCRASEYPRHSRVPEHRGVRLVYLPSWGGKNFAGLVSTFLAVVHAMLFENFDIYFFVNVGMGHHSALARLSGKPVVMSVDGLDWQRTKWGPIGRAYFRSAAHMAVRACTRLVTDAEAMRDYYQRAFGTDSTMIAYGTAVQESIRPELIEQFGLESRGYYLIVSRMIPENNLDTLIEGFVASGTTRKLVVVGGATYKSAFHERLRELADDRVIFTGQVHDQEALAELWCNCYAYLHGHSVGGTNPGLLRALGHGSCVVAHDNAFNREVAGDAALFFARDPQQLRGIIEQLEADPCMAAELRRAAPERVRHRYRWDAVTDSYERLFADAAAGVYA